MNKPKFPPFRKASRRSTGAGLSSLLTLAAFYAGAAHGQFTWNTGTGTWSTDVNWTPVGLPPSDFSTQLVFPATASYTTTNDIGAFQLNRITVSNTGAGTVTIAAASTANSFTFGGVDPTLDITGSALFTGLLVGAPTITKTGPGTFIHDSNNAGFTGTIIINQGTFVNRATTVTPTNFNPVSIVVNNGGTYQFGQATAGDPNLPNATYITVNTGGNVSWQEGEVFGGFHLLGGTITLQNGSATCSGSTIQSWTSGTLTGGTFVIQGNTAINKTTSGTVFVTGGASILAGTGGLNILDGTISLAAAANLGTANISFGDGAATTSGTLVYGGATATKPGDLIANAGGGFVNVESATTVLTVSGNVAGPGNLTKIGAGKLRLAGALNNTGRITASTGVLQIEPVATASSFTVSAGASLIVNTAAGAASLTAPSITLDGSTSSLQFDLDTNTLLGNPLAILTNPDGLTLTGTPALRLTNLQAFANGTYTVIDYNGAPITSGFNLVLPGRTLGNLVYDTADTRINVTISGTDTLKWIGAVSADWDVGSAAGVGGTNNWRLVTGGTATNFINTDSITFDDAATRYDVNLTTAVQPNAVTVNAATNYTFTGSGKLTGPTGLTKAGTGTLTIGTDNDYIGGSTINGGTFQIGNGATAGSVVGTITVNTGSLAFNRTDAYSFSNALVLANGANIVQNGTGTVTFANPLPIGTNTLNFAGAGTLQLGATLSGSGVVNKSGAGTLTLLANNNLFTGTLNINGGTVLLEDLGAGGDLGASAIVMNSGGTFILGPTGNTDLPDTTLATINSGGLFRIEQGENYGGFILNGGEFRFVSSVRTGVNSTAIAAIDGAVVYDLRSGSITTDFSGGSGGALNQGGNATNPIFGTLSKTTAGTVTLAGGVTFQGALALQIKEGTLSMGPANFPSAGTASITMGDATTTGTLQVTGAGSASTARPLILQDGGGTLDIADAGASVTLLGVVNGTGPLTKTGNGTLVVFGANNHTGGTVVVSGSLEADNFSGSATGTGQVTVAGTLSGDGAILTDAGKDITLNGALQPGATGATFGSDFSLAAGTGGKTVFGSASSAVFDLWIGGGTNHTQDPGAADLLLFGGDVQITSGATLKLSNPNGLTFQVGDVYRLFDWSAAGTRTGTWSIDSSALNLSNVLLDSSNLYSAGTIAFVPVPEPSGALLSLIGFTPLALSRRRRSHA